MAVWQFKFTLVPIAGILKAHGRMVEALPEYAARSPDALLNQNDTSFYYWEGVDKTPMHDLAKSILPIAESWSDEATMYGNSDTDDIQIWEDSVYVRLDCSNLNIALLEAIAVAASESNCCLVLCEGGRIILPTPAALLDAVHASSAAQFVKNPRGFLQSGMRIFNSPI